jgi:DNA-damage-inducible protein J
MTTKTEVVRARVNPELKQVVNKILEKLGLSQSEAITMFYNQIALNNGLPFEVKIPNKATRQAIKDVKHKNNLNHTENENKEDFFRQLED